MKARPVIGRLHVLTDEVLQTRFTHAILARCAADGGADVVQYRDKRESPAAARMEQARLLRQILPVGVQLIVNDHVDVTLAAGAEGVHLGPHDSSPAAARRSLGAHTLVGVTANDYESAVRCFAAPVDYIGVGPVFGTRSKTNPPPALGLDTLARIAAAAPMPVIAIGGITPENLATALEAGAHGVAVLAGIVCAPDPTAATGRYRAALDRALQARHVRA